MDAGRRRLIYRSAALAALIAGEGCAWAHLATAENTWALAAAVLLVSVPVLVLVGGDARLATLPMSEARS